MGVRLAFAGGMLCLSLLPKLSAQTHPAPAAFLPYAQARAVFEALDEPVPAPAAWREWIATADRATRARVAQGDETSIVNLLLFGTSFTKEPRITSRQLDEKQIHGAVSARLADFDRALDTAVGRDLSRARPTPGDDRLQFARRTLGDAGQRRARVLSMLERTISEGETHARLTRDAEALGDPSLEFAERSRLYRARGLSTDTTVRTNFAVEEALRGLTPVLIRGSDPAHSAKGRVRRVAIIGPGLDFADKQEGYDFYPQQTIQPFAIMDSLIRLGLASADGVTVTTLDLSARVNDHIEQARRRARQQSPYIIHLPLDAGVPWTPALLTYWQQFGGTIGAEVAPLPVPPAVGPLKVRAIGVRPALVERIVPRDLNITAQHLALADADRFDLIIATNVFVYYDRLQQGLAMLSVASMLRPGGLLLSNNALVELPSIGLTSIGYSRTLYSDRDEDGDLVIWYRMAAR